MCDLNVGIEFTMSSAFNQLLGFFLTCRLQPRWVNVFEHGLRKEAPIITVWIEPIIEIIHF